MGTSSTDPPLHPHGEVPTDTVAPNGPATEPAPAGAVPSPPVPIPPPALEASSERLAPGADPGVEPAVTLPQPAGDARTTDATLVNPPASFTANSIPAPPTPRGMPPALRVFLLVLTSPLRLLRYLWRAEPLSQRTADVFAGGLTLLCLAITGYFAKNVLLKFPNSADEDDYVWVAQRLLEGRLTLPPPPVPDAIAFWWRKVVDGRMICQYPPSWPLLMAPFVALGVPWMANPAMSALTVLLVYRIGRDIYGSPATGIAAGLFLTTNALFILNGAAFFAHPSVLMMMALTIWLFSRAALGQGTTVQRPWRAGLLTGLAAGFLASIRTPDAWAGLLFTSAICTFVMLPRWRQWLRFIPSSMVGAIVGFMPLLAHNKWSTGSWTKTAYTLFTPEAVTPKWEVEYWKTRMQVVTDYRNDFKEWAFDPIYVVVLFAFALFAPGNWKQRLTDVGLFGVIPLVAINVLAFPLSGLHYNSYGPRYAFILLVPMALLLGRALVAALAHRRMTWVMFLPIFYLQHGQVEKQKGVYGARVKERMTLIRAMEAAKVENTVIFMKTNTADMDKWDLTRNDGEYKNPVIYALDLGPGSNVEAMGKMFAGRRAYSWSYEGAPGRGVLSALEPTLGRVSNRTVRMHDAVLQGTLPDAPAPTPPPYTLTGTELFHENGTAMGTEWSLWANGEIKLAVNLPVDGRFRATLWMKGRPAKGQGPHVELTVDGNVVKELDVPEGPYQPYVLDNLEFKTGYHSVGARFTNDVNEGGQDRDLHVQKATLELMPVDAPTP